MQSYYSFTDHFLYAIFYTQINFDLFTVKLKTCTSESCIPVYLFPPVSPCIPVYLTLSLLVTTSLSSISMSLFSFCSVCFVF